MSWDKLIGPATIVYLVASGVAALWWASDISTRLKTAEGNIAAQGTADARITRLETLVVHVDKQLDRIETKLDRRADLR